MPRPRWRDTDNAPVMMPRVIATPPRSWREKYPPQLVVRLVNGGVAYDGDLLVTDVRDLTRDIASAFRARGIVCGIVTVLEKGERKARMNIEEEGF
jgi:hypothetical protein